MMTTEQLCLELRKVLGDRATGHQVTIVAPDGTTLTAPDASVVVLSVAVDTRAYYNPAIHASPGMRTFIIMEAHRYGDTQITHVVDTRKARTKAPVRVGQVWERRHGWARGARVTVEAVSNGDNPVVAVKGVRRSHPRESTLRTHYTLVEEAPCS